MNYYFDTEFLDDGKTIELISIGVACEDGREFYAVSSDFDESRATPWLREHVFNHIPRHQIRLPRGVIAQDLSDFIRGETKLSGYILPKLYGWYSAYDWVALCQLYGPMVGRPTHFPKLAHDVKTIADLYGVGKISKSGFTMHHPLDDAKWCMKVHQACLKRMQDDYIFQNQALGLRDGSRIPPGA